MSLNKLISRHKSKHSKEDPKAKRDVLLPGENLHGFFTDPEDILGLARDESVAKSKQQQKVKEAKSRISKQYPGLFSDEDVLYALRLPFATGNIEKAVRLMTLIAETENYHVRKFNGKVKLLGAINRSGVSCYLDSVLFAMFTHLDSFDIMLDKKLEDPKKDHLAALIRLWVNAERSGELITTDITQEIQTALARCGWKDAGQLRQQDALEAFSFILEQLGFPDLHLKMDIFHSGKEDQNDDHKIIRERVLAMPLPEPRSDGVPIKLEDCFELALIARIDVKRRYEEERRATFSSVRSQRSIDFSKAGSAHVETVEVANSEPQTPMSVATPVDGPPSYQSLGFIAERWVDASEEKALEAARESQSERSTGPRRRASTLRKEVLMPAWQMYSLIPFHTEDEPKSDEEVVEHLRAHRPTFCIALKRYTYNSEGQAVRRDDHVDIPLDMALPQFIYDNAAMDTNSLFQNFKISLQSLVCHRGTHVEAGHYVSLARVALPDGSSKWLLNDDLTEEKVREVDIDEALRTEMPYLLFYRVEPIVADPGSPARDSGVAGVTPSVGSEVDIAELRPPSLNRQGSGLTAGSGSLLGNDTQQARGRTSTSRERPVSMALTDASNGSETSAPPVESPAAAVSGLLRKTSKLGGRRTGLVRAKSQDVMGGVNAAEKRHASSLNRLSGFFSRQDAEAAGVIKPLSAATMPVAAVAANIPSPVPEGRPSMTKTPDSKLKKKDKERSKSRRNSRSRPAYLKKGDGRPERECAVM